MGGPGCIFMHTSSHHTPHTHNYLSVHVFTTSVDFIIRIRVLGNHPP